MKIDVPDYDAEVLDDGRVFVWDNDDDAIEISAKAKPVLLAELLKDAGAVKVEIREHFAGVVSHVSDTLPLHMAGPAWLLPVKDGGTT